MTDHALERAYRETEYRVLTEPPVSLWIDSACLEWAQWQHQHRVASAALITAHNPQGLAQPDRANARAQQALEDALDQAGWGWAKAVACHPSNGWPAEPMALVWGMAVDQANAWARRFGQNAFVWLDAGGTVHLRWVA